MTMKRNRCELQIYTMEYYSAMKTDKCGVHIYTVGYYLSVKRNQCESVERRWKNLEPVIQGEATPKEINKCRILRHIYLESRKTVQRNLFAGQE